MTISLKIHEPKQTLIYVGVEFLFFIFLIIPVQCLGSVVPSVSTNTSKTYAAEYFRAEALQREVSTLQNRVREQEHEKTILSNQNGQLGYKVRELEHEKTILSNQNGQLGYKVRELDRQNTKLSGDLVKQREDTRKAGLLFMNAADMYQQVAKKQIRAKVEELKDTRKASLLLMNAADTYQGVAKKQTKAKEEELEDMRKAVLVLMGAADTYQQEAKKQIKDKVQELKILGAQKSEMDAKATSLKSGLKAALAKNQELEADYDMVKVENYKLQSEVERLMIELGALVEAKVAAEKAELMKESEDLKKRAEEIQTSKDLINGENDKPRLEVLTIEQKHNLSEAEFERLKMELGALTEVKEAENMKEAVV